MTEHYTRNTESVTLWCNKCNRLTQFMVSNGRLGRCKEHEASVESKEQERKRKKKEQENKEGNLF